MKTPLLRFALVKEPKRYSAYYETENGSPCGTGLSHSEDLSYVKFKRPQKLGSPNIYIYYSDVREY
jgi:hypothetical protein